MHPPVMSPTPSSKPLWILSALQPLLATTTAPRTSHGKKWRARKSRGTRISSFNSRHPPQGSPPNSSKSKPAIQANTNHRQQHRISKASTAKAQDIAHRRQVNTNEQLIQHQLQRAHANTRSYRRKQNEQEEPLQHKPTSTAQKPSPSPTTPPKEPTSLQLRLQQQQQKQQEQDPKNVVALEEALRLAKQNFARKQAQKDIAAPPQANLSSPNQGPPQQPGQSILKQTSPSSISPNKAKHISFASPNGTPNSNATAPTVQSPTSTATAPSTTASSATTTSPHSQPKQSPVLDPNKVYMPIKENADVTSKWNSFKKSRGHFKQPTSFPNDRFSTAEDDHPLPLVLKTFDVIKSKPQPKGQAAVTDESMNNSSLYLQMIRDVSSCSSRYTKHERAFLTQAIITTAYIPPEFYGPAYQDCQDRGYLQMEVDTAFKYATYQFFGAVWKIPLNTKPNKYLHPTSSPSKPIH